MDPPSLFTDAVRVIEERVFYPAAPMVPVEIDSSSCFFPCFPEPPVAWILLRGTGTNCGVPPSSKI